MKKFHVSVPLMYVQARQNMNMPSHNMNMQSQIMNMRSQNILFCFFQA